METPRRPSRLSFLPKVLALPAALLLAASPTEARLVLDLRATTATDGATVVDPKTVTLLGEDGVGATINFDLYAMVLPTNGGNGIADETLRSVVAALYTYGASSKNIRADFGAVTISSVFTGPSSGSGLSADLNGDGDLDVGGPLTASALILVPTIPYIVANSITPASGFVPGISQDLPGGIGREWLIGKTTLTIDEIVDVFGDPIFAELISPRINNSVQSTARASYTEDGVQKNAGTIITPLLFAGERVAISVAVPEPGALTLAMLGGIAALGRVRCRA